MKRKHPKVIVVGFSKTGTKSLALAFRELGYNVHDVSETFTIMHDRWCEVFSGKITIADIARIYEDLNVEVLVDMPMIIFWREFQKIWPDVKIILTIRDNSDVWYQSYYAFFNGLRNWPLYKYGSIFLFLSPIGIYSHNCMITPMFQAQYGTVKQCFCLGHNDLDNPSVELIVK